MLALTLLSGVGLRAVVRKSLLGTKDPAAVRTDGLDFVVLHVRHRRTILGAYRTPPLKRLGKGGENRKGPTIRCGTRCGTRSARPGEPVSDPGPGVARAICSQRTEGPDVDLISPNELGRPPMAFPSVAPVDLEPGERVLGAWRGEPVRTDGRVDRGGWLVLTDRRLLFYRRSGLWGPGRLDRPPVFARRLEEVRSVTPHRLWMRIGYGDRVEMLGIGIDTETVRLGRDAPLEILVDKIDSARRARRAALGLPTD